jgi:hypothetical protein
VCGLCIYYGVNNEEEVEYIMAQKKRNYKEGLSNKTQERNIKRKQKNNY